MRKPDAGADQARVKDSTHIETLAVHAGRGVDETTGAVTPPLHLSSTFERDADGAYSRGFKYTRAANPTRDSAERALAALEGGIGTAAFASGTAAAHAVFQLLEPGDHAVVTADAYHGVLHLIRELVVPWGLEVSFVDMRDPDAAQSAVTARTRLLWAETPSNPMLRIADLEALASIAHGSGALFAVDNTFATPVLQRPFESGADMVVHSTTKYIGGHSDLLGGAVIVRDDAELLERLHFVQAGIGAVPAPFDCFLVLRSLATLPLRVRAHSDNALSLAAWLESQPGVTRVHYPFLDSHPQHSLARAQMRAGGGMLSFEVEGGADAAMRIVAATELFTRATSLGGVESLIEHRASVEGPLSNAPQNLVRVSVGVEHVEDLRADLARALKRGVRR